MANHGKYNTLTTAGNYWQCCDVNYIFVFAGMMPMMPPMGMMGPMNPMMMGPGGMPPPPGMAPGMMPMPMPGMPPGSMPGQIPG